jgi:hypothetical protein
MSSHGDPIHGFVGLPLYPGRKHLVSSLADTEEVGAGGGKDNTAADRHLRCNQAWQKRGPQTRLAVQFPYWIADIGAD